MLAILPAQMEWVPSCARLSDEEGELPERQRVEKYFPDIFIDWRAFN